MKQMHQRQLKQQNQQSLRASKTIQAAARMPKTQLLKQKAQQQQLGQPHKLLMV